ncbi:MAG TPA: helix-turn-helix transcriptional regulator [Caulobacteraceae bacterium]
MSIASSSIEDSGGRDGAPGTVRAEVAALRPARLVLSEDGHVGEALRRARESLDLGIEDIALATHIRAPSIAAIETLSLDALPSRPFAVGYVKAYARALGLDQEAVVARFRREAPGEELDLRPPLGVRLRRSAGLRRLAAALAIVCAALAGWNFMVRLRAAPPRPAAYAPRLAQKAGPLPGPAILGPPLPAPPEATTPPPYETPGLAAATAATGPDAAAAATARIAAEAEAARPANSVPLGSPFVAHGAAIYGAPAPGGVVLQAIRPLTLVVRDGAQVTFARALSAGEAWRAPALAGQVADVDDPAAMEAFVGGKAIGPLTASQTAVGSLAAPAPPKTSP